MIDTSPFSVRRGNETYNFSIIRGQSEDQFSIAATKTIVEKVMKGDLDSRLLNQPQNQVVTSQEQLKKIYITRGEESPRCLDTNSFRNTAIMFEYLRGSLTQNEDAELSSLSKSLVIQIP